MKKYIIKLFISIISYLSRRVVLSKKPFVIGITWSIWKTTCRNIISQSLSHLVVDKVIYTPSKNYNNEIWLCLGILSIDEYKPTIFWWLKVVFTGLKRLCISSRYDILVLEYGIDAPGDMDFLLDICTPDVAVMTKIDLVHSANFGGDPAMIFAEKSKLIKSAKSTVFLNQDDPYTHDIYDQIKVDKFTYGVTDDADIYFDNFKLVKSEDSKILSTSSMSIWTKGISLSSNLTTSFMINYVAIWVCISQIYNHKHGNAKEFDTLDMAYSLEPGRFTIFYSDRWVIIDSTYNASPQSMSSAIQNTIDIKEQFFKDYKLILVLGEMRELGPNSKSAHEDIAHKIWDISDHTIWVSGDAEYWYKFLSRLEDYFVETNLDVKNILDNIFDRYEDNQKFIILFKSSQWEIYLEEAIKPWIDKIYYNKLPRQDIFWKRKKLFLHKFEW